MKEETKTLLQESIRESLSVTGYAVVLCLVIIAISNTITTFSIIDICLCIVMILLLTLVSWGMYPVVKDIINSFKKK